MAFCSNKSHRVTAVVEYLHVSDVVVNGLCILVRVVCEVGSDSDIIIDGEDAICNLQIPSGLA